MLIRWQPLQEIETVRRQFDRLFDEVTGLTNTARVSDWTPASELYDEGDSLTLRVAIPGIEAKDLDIQVTKDAVSITGDRPFLRNPEEKGYYWSEIRYGKFSRVFSLPVSVQNDQITADYTNGILTLKLPKANEVKAFKVSLTSTEPKAES